MEIHVMIKFKYRTYITAQYKKLCYSDWPHDALDSQNLVKWCTNIWKSISKRLTIDKCPSSTLKVNTTVTTG